jgi:hypothetical protein
MTNTAITRGDPRHQRRPATHPAVGKPRGAQAPTRVIPVGRGLCPVRRADYRSCVDRGGQWPVRTLTVLQLVATVISTFPTAPFSTAACAAAASSRR